MERQNQERLRQRLMQKKHDLTARLLRIHRNVQSGLDPDPAERAKQLEDCDVIDTLGKEASLELVRIGSTLRRLVDGTFGVCADCGSLIQDARLEAYPYATECIDCARRRDREISKNSSRHHRPLVDAAPAPRQHGSCSSTTGAMRDMFETIFGAAGSHHYPDAA